jgi:clan AA aspartic protease (TIGR02281 family)
VKRYRLSVRSDLFFTRAAFKRERFFRVTTMLIDTGSSFTIISWDTLTSLGIDPATSNVRRSMMTANGLIQAPEVTIEEIHCFGQVVKQFPIVAHSIPLGASVSGVLGMNFLRQHAANLDFMRATIEV